MKTKLVYKSHPFKMKQMKKNGFNSLKPVCYKNAQDFITGPPFCPVPTLLKLSLSRNRFYNF